MILVDAVVLAGAYPYPADTVCLAHHGHAILNLIMAIYIGYELQDVDLRPHVLSLQRLEKRRKGDASSDPCFAWRA